MKTLLAPLVASDPDVMGGAPVVDGTRVAVDLILGDIIAGEALADIEKNYRLSHEQVVAALRYARSLLPTTRYAAAVGSY